MQKHKFDCHTFIFATPHTVIATKLLRSQPCKEIKERDHPTCGYKSVMIHKYDYWNSIKMQLNRAMRKCLKSYANNKGADQPAHPHSLISAFVVGCLDNISRFYSRNFKRLARFCGCTGRFVSGLVGNSRRPVLSCHAHLNVLKFT